MLKVAELFSGIGSQTRALRNIGIKHEIVMTSEWDVYSIIAYDLIHNGKQDLHEYKGYNKEDMIEKLCSYTLSRDGKEPATKLGLKNMSITALKMLHKALKNTNNYGSIVDIKANEIPEELDIMTYSFPCQDLSNVGSFHRVQLGIDRNSNSRSSLLWEVERLLYGMYGLGKKLPKFLLMENVPSITAKRHKSNFEEWKRNLEKLGYYNKVYKLNARDFGVPQNRDRVFMLSIYTGNNNKSQRFISNYFKTHNLENKEYVNSMNFKKKNLKDCLKINYDNKELLAEAYECQSKMTKSRVDIYEKNPKIIDESGNVKELFSRTITTKQDRHPNSGNLYFNTDKSTYRFLTPRECFLLMGFEEEDYEILKKNNIKLNEINYLFSRDKYYKMTGNSIVVNVLEQIFNQIRDIKEIIEF